MEKIDFDQLYSMYSKRLHHIAFSVVRDPFLAEDVVQETFLKAYKKRETIHDSKKIVSWLSAIAARTAIDFLRVERRGNVFPSDRTIIENVLFDTSMRNFTEEIVDNRLFMEELYISLNHLSKEYKEVLILNLHFGLKEKEIAEKLQLKAATVKTRIYRGRKQLREVLANKYSA
jgi:RNA polymerase sigma factor (sigma-70 family)